MGSFLWEFLRLKFSKALMKPGIVQGQNEHNCENQWWSKKELCEYYCLDLHQQLNNSWHHIHWLTSKSDSISLRKVQSHKLPILMQSLSNLYSLDCLFFHLPFLKSISIHVEDCWDIYRWMEIKTYRFN